jgi:hypothetical protein
MSTWFGEWLGDAAESVLDVLADFASDDWGNRRRARREQARRQLVSEAPAKIPAVQEISEEEQQDQQAREQAERDAVADGVWNDIERNGFVWFWDPDGQPISLRAWVDLFSHIEEHALRWETKLPDGMYVRTAWLGSNNGQPLRLGVVPQKNWGTIVGEREIFAATRDQARRDHRLQVKLRREALED